MKKMSFIAIFFLAMGLFSMPYGFYTFLRLFVFITCCCYLYNDFNKDKTNFFYGWLILGLLYNPVFLIHLKRDIWLFLNIASICFISLEYYKNHK